MQVSRPLIGYRTAAGDEIYETTDDKFYVLSGWDGERYIACYKCNWFGERLDNDHHILRPMTAITFDDFNRVVPIGYIFEDE